MMTAIPAPTDAQYKYYLAQCLDKQGFESVALANKVLKTRKIATVRQVYKCEFCGKWHLGTASRARYVEPYKRGK